MLPEFKFEMFLTESHYMTFSITDLNFHLVQCLHDVSIAFNVTKLSLFDSLRPKEYSELISTHINSGDDSNKLISISYIGISSKQSPLYNEHATIISILFSGLNVNFDEHTIISTIPFIEALLLGMGQIDNDKIYSDDIINESDISTSVIHGPIGMKINLYIGNFSMSILRKLQLRSGNSPKLSQLSNNNEFEIAFLAGFSGLKVDFTKKEFHNVKINLSAITLEDKRVVSKNYIYRSLLCKSTIGTNYDHNDSEVSNVDGNDNIFSLTLDQTSSYSNLVIIQFSNITSFVSISSMIELVDVSLLNVTAIQKVLAKINKSLSATVKTKPKVDYKETFLKSIYKSSNVANNENSSLLNVSLAIINPRVLLLENPENSDSKAIVGRCGLQLHYCHDEKNKLTQEIKETLHVTMKNAELFILTEIINGIPQQIIEPTNSEIHINRTKELEREISRNFSFDIDQIIAKVSLNDVLLVNSIIIHANLDKEKTIVHINSIKLLTADNLYDDDDVDEDADSKSSVSDLDLPMSLLLHEYNFNIGLFSFVLINDFHGDYNPIFRLGMDNLCMNVSGCLSRGVDFEVGDLSGDGSVVMSCDYYNNNFMIWEPLIERWQPIISIAYNSASGINVDLTYLNTLQINLTGYMIKNFLHTHQLLLQAKEELSDKHIETRLPIMFCNELGIEIQIWNTVNKCELVSLNVNENKPLPVPDIVNTRDVIKNIEYPSLYDIKFPTPVNEFDRNDITQLPLHVNTPRPYYIKPKVKSSDLESDNSKKNVVFETIAEYVFENERHDIFKWGNPWSTLNDPSRWTDISGNDKYSPEMIQLPSSGRWNWVEPAFFVDKISKKDEEIDKDGWEYGTSFKSFTDQSRVRRNHKPLDTCRRRRYIRNRAPILMVEDENSRPLLMFWDVKLLNYGCRKIVLRSCLQIENNMPFTIDICAYIGNSSSNKIESRSTEYDNKNKGEYIQVLQIEPGEMKSVPILYSHCSSIKCRPHDMPFNWSSSIDCVLRNINTSKPVYVTCNESLHESNHLFMKMIFMKNSKSLTITISGNIKVFNCLPCDIFYKCKGNLTNITGDHVESGSSCNLLYHQLSDYPKISINMENNEDTYWWCLPVPIIAKHDNKQVIELIPKDIKVSNKLYITMLTKKVNGSYEVYFYSRFLLIDRTGLQLSIKSLKVHKTSDCIIKCDEDEDIEADIKQDSDLMTIYNSFGSKSKINTNCINECWYTGSNGLALFQSYDNKAYLGALCGSMWSSDICLLSIDSSKTPIEIIDPNTPVSFQLAFYLTPLPGIFSNTSVLTVIPGYCIVNCMDEEIEIQQVDQLSAKNSSTKVKSMATQVWHKTESSAGTCVHIKSASSEWTLGYIDLNEIGTSTIILPRKDDTNCTTDNELMIARVEVKFSDPEDNAYLTIIIWKQSPDENGNCSSSMLSVKNDSNVPITITQSSIKYNSPSKKFNHSQFELCVLPQTWLPFGWADCNLEHTIIACTGTSIRNNSGGIPVRFNTIEVGTSIELDLVHYNGDGIDSKFSENDVLLLVCEAVGNGKVFHVKRINKTHEKTKKYKLLRKKTLNDLRIKKLNNKNDSKSILKKDLEEMINRDIQGLSHKDIKISLNFRSIGFSIIAEHPHRHEIFAFHIENLMVILFQNALEDKTTSYYDLRIHDIQVDNFLDTAVHPVFIHSFNAIERKKSIEDKKRKIEQERISSYRRSSVERDALEGNLDKTDSLSKEEVAELDKLNFLIASVVKEVNQNNETPILKYAAIRILEIKVAIDSSSLLLYYIDFHRNFIGESSSQALEVESPQKFMKSFNEHAIIENLLYNLVDIDKSNKYSNISKLYFQNFIFHPIKISLSYLPTPFPSNRMNQIRSYKKLSRVVNSVPAIDDAIVRINSFIVESVMESPSSLIKTVAVASSRDLQSNFIVLAGEMFGSMKILGKPAGLYRNIGQGVAGFFYEPYLGLIHSPEGFVRGVGKGTAGLIAGLSTGLITSATSILGSATSGIATTASLLIADEKYSRERATKRLELTSTHGGVKSGIKAGAESVFSGLKSGISGLVTKPLEEGKKGGALGVFKGIGMGVVGLAAKPIIGVTDGISSVTQGIANSISDEVAFKHARPPRAFEMESLDFPDFLALVPLNIMSAKAQEFIVLQKQNYISSISCLDRPKTGALSQVIVLSNTHIYYFDNSETVQWSFSFGELSHCVLKIKKVELILYRGSCNQENIDIICSNNFVAIKVYKLISRHSLQMGNPSGCIPVDCAVHLLGDSIYNNMKDNLGISRGDNNTIAVTSETYQFGSANGRNFDDYEKLKDVEIINQAKSRFLGHYSSDKFKLCTELDEDIWKLIHDWRNNHYNFNSSRCCALLFLNSSETNIHIIKASLKEGKEFNLFGVNCGKGYDEESRNILPGGGCLLFAYGFLPIVLSKDHIIVIFHLIYLFLIFFK
jgi:hypothetical protein